VEFNGSFLAHVCDLAGSNPIILVVTKVIICMLVSNIIIQWGDSYNDHTFHFQVDLLPKGSDLNCVGDWAVEATTKKKLK
jgi:nitric-oxide synthase